VSTVRSSRFRVIRGLVVLAGVLGFLYLAHIAILDMTSTEGDVPPASRMGFPDDADVVNTEKTCGSGGCTSVFTVRPGATSSPDGLAVYLSLAFDGGVPGSFFDPRTAYFETETRGTVVVVSANYWHSYEAQ